MLDGKPIDNPLYSYKFTTAIHDHITPSDYDYSKPVERETVRYPFSSLYGPKDSPATAQHNEAMRSHGEAWADKVLNENVKNWLELGFKNDREVYIPTGSRAKYYKCLDAPNYTVFSNRTSANHYNEERYSGNEWVDVGPPGVEPQAVVSVESPHDDIHLAVGGY